MFVGTRRRRKGGEGGLGEEEEKAGNEDESVSCRNNRGELTKRIRNYERKLPIKYIFVFAFSNVNLCKVENKENTKRADAD